nr:transcriptional regulator [Amycolatopsis sp.]
MPMAAKQRQLLAFFLLNADRFVSVSECIDELWDGAIPDSVVPTLQTYTMQLRKILRRAGDRVPGQESRLVTGGPGYTFLVRPGELDVDRFEALLRLGQDAIAARDEVRAARLLSEALDSWRGPALADVRPGPLLRARLAELAERRRFALDQRIDLDLRLGRHHALLHELSTRVERHPLDENAHAQFMLALYRSGRRARALEVFERLRRRLGEDHGLEPAPPIQRLRAAVVAADPRLDPVVHAPSALSLDLFARAG